MITLNIPGARNLAEARQWFIDGKGVYVTVSGDMAELHLRGEIVAVRPTSEITCGREAQDWATEYLFNELIAESVAEQAEYRVAMDAMVDQQFADMIEHMEAAETTAAVAEIHQQGEAKMAEAAELEAQGTGDVRYPRLRNGEQRGWWTCTATDPRHPASRAASLRREAERLLSWTKADEDAYRLYVSYGLADTEGYFAPEDRGAWSYCR